MKKLLMVLMLILTAAAIGMSSAQAKRLGGGGSFGKQSPSYSRQMPSQPAAPGNISPTRPATPAAAPGAAAAKPASPWKGILGGALLGLGMGALLSHFGLGGAFGSMIGSLLMIAVLAFAVMFVIRMFNRKNASSGGNGNQPAFAASNPPEYGATYTPEIGSRIEPTGAQTPFSLQTDNFSAGAGGVAAKAAPWGIPADFDVPGFVRNGKAYFIRLQDAWDKANINDIREFTTPEMFAELRLQLQERGPAQNQTDVVQIDGELLGIDTVGDDYLATLKFTGLIKEAPDASAEPFAELWNLSKPQSGNGGWVLAGIQQVS